MAKPATLDGYNDQYTLDCERVLVTLLRGLGPWKDSVYLVGGLAPRYLVAARPPMVPAHAGTMDVDIVIDLQILADTEAYHTLEENL
ncbi:MAG: antitoxin, partial [Burkholderiales bacterium]|nr:antitoxin [Burkholderiales bacterium]